MNPEDIARLITEDADMPTNIYYSGKPIQNKEQILKGEFKPLLFATRNIAYAIVPYITTYSKTKDGIIIELDVDFDKVLLDHGEISWPFPGEDHIDGYNIRLPPEAIKLAEHHWNDALIRAKKWYKYPIKLYPASDNPVIIANEAELEHIFWNYQNNDSIWTELFASFVRGEEYTDPSFIKYSKVIINIIGSDLWSIAIPRKFIQGMIKAIYEVKPNFDTKTFIISDVLVGHGTLSKGDKIAV